MVEGDRLVVVVSKEAARVTAADEVIGGDNLDFFGKLGASSSVVFAPLGSGLDTTSISTSISSWEDIFQNTPFKSNFNIFISFIFHSLYPRLHVH
jgi:hypothetical protein